MIPQSVDDKHYKVKANIIRVLLDDIDANLSGNNIPNSLSQSVVSKMGTVRATLTLYDDPSDERNNSGGFVQSLENAVDSNTLLDIAQGNAGKINQTSLSRLKAIAKPAYLKSDIESLIKIYEEAQPYFDKADMLWRESDTELKGAEKIGDSSERLTAQSKASDKSFESLKNVRKGRSITNAAKSMVTEIGKKIDDTPAVNKSLTSQLDSLVSATRQ